MNRRDFNKLLGGAIIAVPLFDPLNDGYRYNGENELPFCSPDFAAGRMKDAILLHHQPYYIELTGGDSLIAQAQIYLDGEPLPDGKTGPALAATIDITTAMTLTGYRIHYERYGKVADVGKFTSVCLASGDSLRLIYHVENPTSDASIS